MDPELECFDAQTGKAGGFGELKGGFMVRCSLGTCRKYAILNPITFTFFTLYLRLLDPKYFLLKVLGSTFPLEAAVGINGRVWISTKDVRHTIAFARCIEAVDSQLQDMTEVKFKAFLRTLDI